MQQFYRKV